jgi:hypothetical protein
MGLAYQSSKRQRYWNSYKIDKMVQRIQYIRQDKGSNRLRHGAYPASYLCSWK